MAKHENSSQLDEKRLNSDRAIPLFLINDPVALSLQTRNQNEADELLNIVMECENPEDAERFNRLIERKDKKIARQYVGNFYGAYVARLYAKKKADSDSTDNRVFA